MVAPGSVKNGLDTVGPEAQDGIRLKWTAARNSLVDSAVGRASEEASAVLEKNEH